MATSSAFTSAGTTMHVSAGNPATYNAAGYAALAWTQVGEITDMGSFGKRYNIVTHAPLDDRKIHKRKGSYDNGTLSARMARIPTNAGQAILVTGLSSDSAISVKVTLQSGTILYFQAQVVSYTTEVGSSDQIVGAQVDLDLTEEIITV